MGECHKCEHRAEMEAGKYAGRSFWRTPCAKCELREMSVRTIEVDVERPVFMPGHVGEGSCEMGGDGVDGEIRKLPVDVMESFVGRLLTLPQELRDVVCWRYMGLEYKEIARRQRITTAGAEARHERAMRMFPELKALFVVKVAKHDRRVRRGMQRGAEKGREQAGNRANACGAGCVVA